MSVLVVDDQPLPRLLIKTILEALDYSVLEATDGAEGLQVFLRHREDIVFVFLDLMMPRLDGWRMAQALRDWETKQRWQPVPVVACTSEDVRQGTELYERCLQSGMDDVTNKPISRSLCAQLLDRWLGPTYSEKEGGFAVPTSAAAPASDGCHPAHPHQPDASSSPTAGPLNSRR